MLTRKVRCTAKAWAPQKSPSRLESGDLGIIYWTSVSANYNCRMLRRIVYCIFRIASFIVGAIGIISIPSDLKEWTGLFAVISNYLPDRTLGVAMVVVALILFFTPNWWGFVIGEKG